MEIINERYHVINKINENNLFTSYLVKDSFNGDKISELSIITGGNIKEAQVESVFNDFIKLTHIKSKYVIELYKFDVTKNIDNKVVGEIHYLYIKEKFKPDISLYALGKKLNQYEKMDVFIDICRAVYYMHLKGITYGELNPSNILIQWDEKNYKIKLLDYITVQLNKCDCSSINDDFIYKTIDYYKSEKDYYLDFYSLGVILKKLYEQIEDIDYLKKINYIADKLIIPETDGYRGLIDLVADINNMLNTNYALFNIDEMKVLNFNNSLAGRDKELNSVINREKSNLNIDFSKKLILLHGEQGVGKTRFLNEIKFIYNMNKFNIYSYVNTKESSKNQLSPLDEIFCKIISECDIMIFEKYKEYLLEFIPGSVQFSKYTEDKLNDISEKYILFNGIANFIGEFANDKGLVFIIDDVDLADTFTMEFIEYLYVKNINNVKMQFIISYIEGREINNFKFYDFTNKIKKNTDVLDIYLQGLDENNSDIFIENVLDAKYISKEFTSLIYKRTYGNPLFIEETLKIFFEKEYFTIDKNDGKWIDNGVNSNLKKMKMPTYLEKNALNPIKNISKSEYEVLKTLSIFNEDISLKILSKYYEMDIYKIIMSFIKKGILAKKSVNNDEMLYFLNTILKIIIHDKLEEQDKINRHLKLSRVLEEEFANKEFYQDNLLYHLEKSNQMTKVVEYCIKNSNYMDKTNTNLNSIRYLEKAINFYPSNLEIEGKVDLYVKIANKHYSYGRPKDALFYYKEAENIPFSSKDIKLKIDIINKITEVYLVTGKKENAKVYLEKSFNLLKKIDYIKGNLVRDRILSIIYNEQKDYEKAIELINKDIILCNDDNLLVKGDFYGVLANINFEKSEKENVIYNLGNALKCYQIFNEEMGIIKTLTSYALVYLELYQKPKVSLAYLNKIKEIGKKTNNILYKLYADTNIASIFYYEINYTKSLEVFEKSEKISKEIDFNFYDFNYKNNKSLLNLLTSNIDIAMKYYESAIEIQRENPRYDRQLLFHFYVGAKLYYELGKFKKANEILDKAFERFKNNVSKLMVDINVLSLKIKYRLDDDFKNKIDIYEVNEIIEGYTFNLFKIECYLNFAIFFHKFNRVDLSRRLLDRANGILMIEANDNIEAMSFYLKGLLGDIDEKKLIKSAKISKENKNIDIYIKISNLLGDYNYKKGNYFYAANFYLESCEAIKEVLNNIPVKYKQNYIKNNNFFYPFRRINDVRKNYKIKTSYKNNDEFIYENFKLEDIKKLFDYEDVKEIIKDDIFINMARENHNETSFKINSLEDLMNNLNEDSKLNISNILKYLVKETFATNGYIIVENSGSKLKVFSSYGENNGITRIEYILKRVKDSKKELIDNILLNDANIESKSLRPKEIKAFICVPIILETTSLDSVELERRKRYNQMNRVIGYIYLESDKVLNNISNKTLKITSTLSRLAGICIEKYNLNKISSIDKLTGAYTRKKLDESLNEIVEISHNSSVIFSVIMIDIDHFKSVNDRFGHQAGDQVLENLCKVMLTSIRNRDILGRYGGEEFLLILPETSAQDAFNVADKLRMKIADSVLLKNNEIITVSMGIASYPEQGYWKTELIENADKALYIAKENGRNKCVVWDNEYINMAKSNSKLTGIINGSAVSDYRNILTLIELSELIEKDICVQDKVSNTLSRLIELIDAEYGILVRFKDDIIDKKYFKGNSKLKSASDIKFNEKIVYKVYNSKQGFYSIDWEDNENINPYTDLIDWNSILVCPAIKSGKVKGVLYFKVSAKHKEFSFEDYNIINVFARVVAGII